MINLARRRVHFGGGGGKGGKKEESENQQANVSKVRSRSIEGGGANRKKKRHKKQTKLFMNESPSGRIAWINPATKEQLSQLVHQHESNAKTKRYKVELHWYRTCSKNLFLKEKLFRIYS